MTPPMEPPGTPPGTPPTTPADAMAGGGASSSLIICTFLGILVGVRSSPLTISVWICFTTLTGPLPAVVAAVAVAVPPP